MEPTDFVCKLEVADIPRRTRQLETLVPQVVARRRKGRILTIDVPAATEEFVRAFVADESKCCSFFSFRIDRVSDCVRLTVETPSEGEAMLDALETVFDPNPSSVPARFEPLGPSLQFSPGEDRK